jgi:hypothetical protein
MLMVDLNLILLWTTKVVLVEENLIQLMKLKIVLLRTIKVVLVVKKLKLLMVQRTT